MRPEEVHSWEDKMRRLRDSGTALTELRLSHTSIGQDHLRELGLALVDNSTLTSLHLEYWYDGSTAAGAANLSEGVRKSASLATLSLKYSGDIGNSGAQALGVTLVATSTLTNLALSFCGITAEGAVHLAEGVGKSASLANLDGNSLGDSGAQALGVALAATSTLTSLYWALQLCLGDLGGGRGAPGGGCAARPAAACPLDAARSRPGPGSSAGGPRRYCRRLGQGAGCAQRPVCRRKPEWWWHWRPRARS